MEQAKFWITIKEGWEQYRYKVEHIPIDERTEHFKVHGRNGCMLLNSNRPLFWVKYSPLFGQKGCSCKREQGQKEKNPSKVFFSFCGGL